MTSGSQIARTRRLAGFTLLEVMAVVLILGSVLLIVPLNMDGWGARSRLDLAANSVIASIHGTKEQAIQDGYDAYLELGWAVVDDTDEERSAYRVKFTNIASEKATRDDDATEAQERARSREREWLYTEWRPLPDDIEWAGVSERKDAWRPISQGGKAYSIHFDAGGNTDQSIAIRIKSVALDVSEEDRTITIVLNGLTSEASWVDGKHEIRESLDQAAFNY
ncbi:MAG: type II secretion system protein [Planctomycetota bacterium]|nr:type II secretion system protein [Planctomycetota bacterium]